MRRETLIRALSRILKDISDSGMPQMIEQAIEDGRPASNKSEGVWFSFSVFQNYSIATSDYLDVENEILEIINLSNLKDPKFWESLIREPDRGEIFSIRSNLKFALIQLPRIINLIKPDHFDAVRSSPDARASLPEELRGKDLITVTLPEDNGQYSNPERLLYAIDSISKLYSAFSDISGSDGNDLIVLSCDSGSDKSFDFLGLSKVMESVKELVLGLWDRKVMYRHTQMSASITLITQSLPVISQVDELIRLESISPEQGELIKRKILDGATKFLECGAITKEMEQNSNHSPRVLMRPEQKLLAAPVGASSNDYSRSDLEYSHDDGRAVDEEISTDEIRQLRELLKSSPSRSTSSTAGPKSRSRRKT